jgi:hypothetical protein
MSEHERPQGERGATRAAVEPPARFATEGVRWAPADGAPPAQLATEWTVEARDGDSPGTVMYVQVTDPGREPAHAGPGAGLSAATGGRPHNLRA